MPLIFVTGISTAGKSTIAKELSNRGYEAYDTEHNDMSAWYNKKTGKRVAGFGEMTHHSNEWESQHAWNISLEKVKELAVKAKNKTIFLCGTATNDKEVSKLCSQVIWLKTNEKTIKLRVVNTRDHTYGKEPNELARIIANNKRKEQEYKSMRAIMIDSTKPKEVVVDEVLSYTENAKDPIHTDKKLKIRIISISAVEQKLLNKGAEFIGDLDNKFTYFNQPPNKVLKIIVNQNGNYLMKSEKQGKRFEVVSNRQLDDIAIIKNKLSKEFGISKIVHNTQKIYKYKDLTITLNHVEGIGNFLTLVGQNPKIEVAEEFSDMDKLEIVAAAYDSLK